MSDMLEVFCFVLFFGFLMAILEFSLEFGCFLIGIMKIELEKLFRVARLVGLACLCA